METVSGRNEEKSSIRSSSTLKTGSEGICDTWLRAISLHTHGVCSLQKPQSKWPIEETAS